MVKAMCPVTDCRQPAYVRVSRANVENSGSSGFGMPLSTTTVDLYSFFATGTHRYILPNCGDVKTTAVLVKQYTQVYNQKFFASKSI